MLTYDEIKARRMFLSFIFHRPRRRKTLKSLAENYDEAIIFENYDLVHGALALKSGAMLERSPPGSTPSESVRIRQNPPTDLDGL